MTLGESLFAVIWKAEKLEEDDNNNKDRHARTHTGLAKIREKD